MKGSYIGGSSQRRSGRAHARPARAFAPPFLVCGRTATRFMPRGLSPGKARPITPVRIHRRHREPGFNGHSRRGTRRRRRRLRRGRGPARTREGAARGERGPAGALRARGRVLERKPRAPQLREGHAAGGRAALRPRRRPLQALPRAGLHRLRPPDLHDPPGERHRRAGDGDASGHHRRGLWRGASTLGRPPPRGRGRGRCRPAACTATRSAVCAMGGGAGGAPAGARPPHAPSGGRRLRAPRCCRRLRLRHPVPHRGWRWTAPGPRPRGRCRLGCRRPARSVP